MSVPIDPRTPTRPFHQGPVRLHEVAMELIADPTFLALTPPTADGRSQAVEVAEALVADLAARLRVACSHMGEPEFARLLLDVARMKVRLAAIDDRWAQRAGGAALPVD